MQKLGNRGSVFIIALWILFALSILAVSVNAYVTPQINLAKKLMNRLKMRNLAVAGVERAILELKNNDEEEYSSLNGTWSNSNSRFKDVELDGGIFSLVNEAHPEGPGRGEPELRYGLVDEERKININKAPQDVLKNFFEIIGEAASEKAEEIAACVKDWRDKDDQPEKDGAESFHYLTLRPPYECKNGDFQVPEELLLVKGVTPEIFNRIKDRVAVYGEGAVNINTADELVLRSLGIERELSGQIVSFRRGSDGKEATEDDNVFTESSGITAVLTDKISASGEENSRISHLIGSGLLGVRSTVFRGRAVGTIKNAADSFSIVFIFDRGKKVMRYWREE